MADIELVVKIDEEDYKEVLNINNRDCTWNNMHSCYEAILNGTPLPKGHGRLIDANVLDRDLENAQVNLVDALSEAFDDGLTWASEVLSKEPTILEANMVEPQESEDKK